MKVLKGIHALQLLSFVVLLASGALIRGSCTTPACMADFGRIISESDTEVKNAIVEKVVMRVRKSEQSPEFIERNAVFVRHPNARGTVVMCHGFMCNKHDQAFLRLLFPGFNTFSFDFRGHGENGEGQVSTLGQEEANEVLAAGNFVKHHPATKGLPVHAFGFSMGAVAIIEAQSKDGTLFAKLILDCPFESSEKVLKRLLAHLKLPVFGYTFEFPGKEYLEQYAFHPYVQSLVRVLLKVIVNMDARDIAMHVQPFYPGESAKKITVPVLFIHCKKDKKVSVEAIKEVYNNTASDYKILRITTGRGHFDSYFYNPERYAEWVKEFLDQNDLHSIKRHEIFEDFED